MNETERDARERLAEIRERVENCRTILANIKPHIGKTWHSPLSKALSDIPYLLDEIARLSSQEPTWHKVSEKLPEDGQRVFIYAANTKEVLEADYFSSNPEGGIAHFDTSRYDDSPVILLPGKHVKYWMPYSLPPSPTEETK